MATAMETMVRWMRPDRSRATSPLDIDVCVYSDKSAVLSNSRCAVLRFSYQ